MTPSWSISYLITAVAPYHGLLVLYSGSYSFKNVEYPSECENIITIFVWLSPHTCSLVKCLFMILSKPCLYLCFTLSSGYDGSVQPSVSSGMVLNAESQYSSIMSTLSWLGNSSYMLCSNYHIIIKLTFLAGSLEKLPLVRPRPIIGL